nr:salicylate synthase [Pantoea multigeneris]
MAQQTPSRAEASHSLEVQAEPLDILYHLLQHEMDNYIAYERDESWDIGIGSQAQIVLFKDRAELTQPNSPMKSWQEGSWQENLQRALQALPSGQWQACGISHFELARLIHNVALHTLPETTALITLVIPRVTLKLSRGTAQLTASNPVELQQLLARVREADRTAEIPAPNADWQAAIAHRIRAQDAHDYCQRVGCAVEEIQRGTYQKIILSRRITLTEPVDLLASYHLGRRNNTPARSFAVRLNGERFVGFSPETVVEVSPTGAVSTQPLAGTRALTHNEAENLRLREVLTNDTKEIAEHAVSVKLAVEELTPLCVDGSTHVSDFMNVSRRGSVQHLASRVRGQLQEALTPWDAFAALFPAVTASGIPKRPAIEAIERLEPAARGAYSGSVFTLNSLGEMDAALVLRSLYQLEQGVALQAGAGIIDQSIPERELEETIEKLQSVSRFIIPS